MWYQKVSSGLAKPTKLVLGILIDAFKSEEKLYLAKYKYWPPFPGVWSLDGPVLKGKNVGGPVLHSIAPLLGVAAQQLAITPGVLKLVALTQLLVSKFMEYGACATPTQLVVKETGPAHALTVPLQVSLT